MNNTETTEEFVFISEQNALAKLEADFNSKLEQMNSKLETAQKFNEEQFKKLGDYLFLKKRRN